MKVNEGLIPQLQCTHIAESVGKVGGHFIYQYEENELTYFINNPNGRKMAKLDTLYGNTLVYAATPRNKTKKVIVQSDTLVPMPLQMQLLVINHYLRKAQSVQQRHQPHTNHASSKLGILAEKALQDEEAMMQLLHIITTPQYKQLMEKNSTSQAPLYHPDRVPDGNGYNYLLAIASVLMRDPSISQQVYKEVLLKINEMFTIPLEYNRLSSNIIARDIASPSFRYNEQWKNATYSFVTNDNRVQEVYLYYNKGTSSFLVVDSIARTFNTYTAFKGVSDLIASTTGQKISNDKLVSASIYVDVVARPDMPFGLQEDTKIFNTYKRTKEQEVFYDPSSYYDEWSEEEKTATYNERHPRWPTTILGILKNSCGKHAGMFLSFTKRKLTTREHSPLFFVFHGVPHSGKSVIVNGILAKLSNERHKTMDPAVITDKYNAWIANTDFALIDEAHHIPEVQLAQLVHTCNKLTGNDTIAGIREMHKDLTSEVIKNEVTIVYTTNAPFKATTEVQDRRMVVFSSSTKASEALELSDADIKARVQAESVDFAYYLARMVRPLADTDYLSNEGWKDTIYRAFKEEQEPVEERLASALIKCDMVELRLILNELGFTPNRIRNSITVTRGAKLRLRNSNQDKAKSTGLLNALGDRLNEKKLRKLLPIGDSDLFVSSAEFGANRYLSYNIDKAIHIWKSKDNPHALLPVLLTEDDVMDALGIKENPSN